jgi:hypothetical protein
MACASGAGIQDDAVSGSWSEGERFRIFAGSSMLVMDLQIDAVLGVLKGGLEDMESIDVSPHFPC